MQSGGKVCIYVDEDINTIDISAPPASLIERSGENPSGFTSYVKSQPLFTKLTKLQTLFAKPLETNRAMQSLFEKPLKMLLNNVKETGIAELRGSDFAAAWARLLPRLPPDVGDRERMIGHLRSCSHTGHHSRRPRRRLRSLDRADSTAATEANRAAR